MKINWTSLVYIQLHQVAVALDLCGLHGLAAAANLAVLLKQRHLEPRHGRWKSELTNMASQSYKHLQANMMLICCQYV